MARNTARGRKIGGTTRSRVIGRLTQRLAGQELLAAQEEKQLAYQAALARWEESQLLTARATELVN